MQRKRFWVRKSFTEERKERGEWIVFFENLLIMIVRENYYRYLWMSPECLEHLFNLIGPLLAKQDTNYRKSIPAKNPLLLHFVI